MTEGGQRHGVRKDFSGYLDWASPEGEPESKELEFRARQSGSGSDGFETLRKSLLTSGPHLPHLLTGGF